MHNKILCSIYIGMALSVVSSIANAGWNYNLNPGSIRSAGNTGSITFAPTNATVVAGCSVADFYVIVSSNNPNSALAILLSASLSGRSVSVFVPDDSTKCDPATGRPRFTDIYLN